METWLECKNREGFIQRIVILSQKGYPYFIRGEVPELRDPDALDGKMFEKYPLEVKKRRRSYRKEIGLENGFYIRHGRSFLLMMTDPSFVLDIDPKERVLDMRESPVEVLDYSIKLALDGSKKRVGVQKLRVSVRLSKEYYRELKAHFESLAVHRKAEALGAELWRVSTFHVKYQPIYRQFRAILNSVNEKRKKAGFERVPFKHIRWYQKSPRHFGFGDAGGVVEMLGEEDAA